MDLIKFELEGFMNSVRYEFSRKNHKTFLIPPKTTIIGLIVNCAGGSINLFKELQQKVKIGAFLKNFSSIISDTWSYKLLESKSNKNTSVVQRERLFLPTYQIYVLSDDKKILDMIFNCLKMPKRTSYIGQNDEMAIIRNVEHIQNVEEKPLIEVHSSFYGLEIKKQKINNSIMIPLRQVITPISYKFENNKRLKDKEAVMCDFYGISVEVEEFMGIVDGDKQVFLY